MSRNYCLCGCGKEIRPESKWAKGHNPNKTKDRFDWSNVIEDYKRLGTLDLVAEEYGSTLQAVYYQLKKRKVKTPLRKFDWSNLLSDYKELGTVEKVAMKYKCSETMVSDNLLKMYGYRINHDNKTIDNSIGLGRYGERIALGLLDGAKDMNLLNVEYPYDIEWEGKKVDVKTSRKRKRKYGENYTFRTVNKECTHYLTISLDEDFNPIRFMLIPFEEVNAQSISYTVGKKSKWDKYILEVNENELERIVSNAKRIG